MQDFRTAKETVKKVIAEVRANDENWGWRADVLKSEIRIWWGYLQYAGTKDSHFTIKMADEVEGNENDDFIVAHDEYDEYMNGVIIDDSRWGDGDFNQCVAKLIRGIARTAHNCY